MSLISAGSISLDSTFNVSTLIAGRMSADQQINMLSLQPDTFKNNFFNLKRFTIEELKKEKN